MEKFKTVEETCKTTFYESAKIEVEQNGSKKQILLKDFFIGLGKKRKHG